MPFTPVFPLAAPRGKSNLAILPDEKGIFSQARCLVSPESVPVFIIPGIHGKNLEVIAIAQALLKNNPDRPVYVYQDELYASPSHDPQPTLIEHAKTIADQIFTLMNMSTVPLALVGYSFGAMLAVEAAKLLEARREIPSPVFVIDGVSKEVAREYYLGRAATNDMAIIIDSAANLCGIKPTQITPADIHRLSNGVDPIRRLNDLARRVLENNMPTSTNNNPSEGLPDAHKIDAFKRMYKIIKQNINCIRQHDDDAPETIPTKLSTLHVILTTETRKKVGCQIEGRSEQAITNHDSGGWRKHTNLFCTLGNPYINAQPHLALLKNERNTTLIARMISDSIKQLMPVEYLTNLQIKTLRRMNEQAQQQAQEAAKFVEITSSESETSGEEYYSCSPPPELAESEPEPEPEPKPESPPNTHEPESKKLKIVEVMGTVESLEIARLPMSLFSQPKSEPSAWSGINRTHSPISLNKSG